MLPFRWWHLRFLRGGEAQSGPHGPRQASDDRRPQGIGGGDFLRRCLDWLLDHLSPWSPAAGDRRPIIPVEIHWRQLTYPIVILSNHHAWGAPAGRRDRRDREWRNAKISVIPYLHAWQDNDAHYPALRQELAALRAP